MATTYVVKKGDTLTGIAKQFGTTYQQIAKDNGISNPNKISVGQKLTIGGNTASTTTPAPTPTAYQYEKFEYEPYTKSEKLQGYTNSYEDKLNNGKPVQQDSAWLGQLQNILDKILNKEEFSYDLNGDVLYQQYKDQFVTQGKQASMDVMGQAAATTGGYGNSYAQSVAQQTYQGYLQQLNDKVPELFQIARDQHNQDYQDLKDQASILNSLVQQDYEKGRDAVADYYKELEALGGLVDTMSEEEYKLWSDKVGMNYNIHSDTQKAGASAKDDATELAFVWMAQGAMPPSEVLAAAGISTEAAQDYINKVKENEKKNNSVSVNNPGGDDPIDDDGGTPKVDPSSASIVEFRKKVDDYTKNWDAVMRHMWGSPKTYIAKQIEESNLPDAEKAYLISLYGITENDLNYKK